MYCKLQHGIKSEEYLQRRKDLQIYHTVRTTAICNGKIVDTGVKALSLTQMYTNTNLILIVRIAGMNTHIFV